MSQLSVQNGRYLNLIKIVSVVVPVLVAILIYLPDKQAFGSWVYLLPAGNAAINTATSLILITALIAIRMQMIDLHRRLMSSAFLLGAVFLLSYVIYHASVDSVVYGDTNGDGVVGDAELAAVGSLRTVYIAVLLSHILLSMVVVPLVLFAFYFSLTDQIAKHKRIVRFAYPIWLYVSITGVVVYLMISPYYSYR